MATFFLTANDYTVGDTLADIPEIVAWFGSVDVEVKNDSNNNYFMVSKSAKATDEAVEIVHGLALTGIVDTREKFRDEANESHAVTFGSGATRSNLTCRTFNTRGVDSNTDRLLILQNGGASVPAEQQPLNVSLNAYSQQTFDGSLWEVWYWETTSTKPVTPYFSYTDTETYSGDKVGIMVRNKGETKRLYWIGIGTDGDAAPTSAAEIGPDTPVNPSITDLLATSARLNWEQG